jgi:hypothetical protein
MAPMYRLARTALIIYLIGQPSRRLRTRDPSVRSESSASAAVKALKEGGL